MADSQYIHRAANSLTMQVELTQLRRTSLLIYWQPLKVYQFGRQSRLNQLEALRDSTKYSGMMTAGSQKRIRRCLDLLLQVSPEHRLFNPVLQRYHNFRLSFITLTCPPEAAKLDHKAIKAQLLQPVLAWLRNNQGARSYIWKAELTKKNVIHFHITTNRFINHTELRSEWNTRLKKAGILDRFYTENGHFNPNSIDIHSVKKMRNIESYLAKYLSKKDTHAKKVLGKVWDCSQNLRGKPYYTFHQTAEQNRLIMQRIANGSLELIEKDQCIILTGPEYIVQNTLTVNQSTEYNDYMHRIANHLPEPTIPDQPIAPKVEITEPEKEGNRANIDTRSAQLALKLR